MVNVRYWHLTDNSIAAAFCPLLDQSGHGDLTAACALMPKSIAINKRDRCVWH